MSRNAPSKAQLSNEFVQDSSDEDNDAESACNDHDKKAIKAAGSPVLKIVASSDGSSVSDSSSESKQSSDSSSRKRAGNQASRQTRTLAKRQKRSILQVPAKPFKAPIGFEPLTWNESAADTGVSEVFNDLDGKQVWHITAPAALDLSEIEQLDVDAVLRGGPILSTGGVSYGMQSATNGGEALLLPYGNPVVYKPIKTRIARSFQLRQISASPKAFKGDSMVAEEGVTALDRGTDATQKSRRQVVRKQPVGKLNYQYVPFGVTRDTLEKSRSENAPGESLLRKAASQHNGIERVPSTPDKAEKKRRKKSKLTDGPGI